MINVASISVPTTLAVGETIPGTEQIAHIAGNCDNAEDKGLEIVSCYYGTGAEIPGLKGVYDSGVPGIGVALMNDQGQRISGAGGVNCISTGTPLGYVSSDGKQTFNFDVTLELVKTSDTVASGTLNQSQTQHHLLCWQRYSERGHLLRPAEKPDGQSGGFPGQRFYQRGDALFSGTKL